MCLRYKDSELFSKLRAYTLGYDLFVDGIHQFVDRRQFTGPNVLFKLKLH